MIASKSQFRTYISNLKTLAFNTENLIRQDDCGDAHNLIHVGLTVSISTGKVPVRQQGATKSSFTVQVISGFVPDSRGYIAFPPNRR